MVRLRSRVREAGFGVRSQTIVFAGFVGDGVGLAADIAAAVVRSAKANSIRRRRYFASGLREVSCERLTIVAPEAAREVRSDNTSPVSESSPPVISRNVTDLLVVWNEEAAEIVGAAQTAAELIVVDAGVPTWRRDLLNADQAVDGRGAAIVHSARALGLVSRRLPFAVDAWRRALLRHVPPKYRDLARRHFNATSA